MDLRNIIFFRIQSSQTRINQGFLVFFALVLFFSWIDKSIATFSDYQPSKSRILLTQKDNQDENNLLIGVWEAKFTSKLGPVEIKYLFREENVFFLSVKGITLLKLSGDYKLVGNCIYFSNQINPETGASISGNDNLCIEWIDNNQFQTEEGVIYRKKSDN